MVGYWLINFSSSISGMSFAFDCNFVCLLEIRQWKLCVNDAVNDLCNVFELPPVLLDNLLTLKDGEPFFFLLFMIITHVIVIMQRRTDLLWTALKKKSIWKVHFNSRIFLLARINWNTVTEQNCRHLIGWPPLESKYALHWSTEIDLNYSIRLQTSCIHTTCWGHSECTEVLRQSNARDADAPLHSGVFVLCVCVCTLLWRNVREKSKHSRPVISNQNTGLNIKNHRPEN